ncbi:hypothetical protein PRIPAC_74486, partial [Pristionchus pacificus]|uniref:Uncharacterized protein n=1 Tax=Pristionchus pacificus TaxID=54126 RepID=A0A2A6C6A1_PRIPA
RIRAIVRYLEVEFDLVLEQAVFGVSGEIVDLNVLARCLANLSDDVIANGVVLHERDIGGEGRRADEISAHNHVDRDLYSTVLQDCGTAKNPRCRPPFSMPYKGQNGVATCARLRCPDNYDMFVNTAASARMGNRILDFTPQRVVMNPQTAVCAQYQNAETYKFQIRDSEGFLRLVNDVQCQQNNFPRHSCVTDGFLQQTCTKKDRCTQIRYLSDYAGNKCNEPFKLMMKFDSDHSRWVPMKKLSCDREFGWWRIHFPNGTWMHTRHGTIATCVAMKVEDDLSSRWLSIAIKTVLLIMITLLTVAVIFNAYMTRAVVIWEGSNWQRIWRQELLEATQLSENRDYVQRDIEYYARGLHMDLRQYDVMQRVVDKSDVVPNKESHA